ncbi:MFS transporter [Pedobacter nutrimenti]|uniref:Putative MFS family arabinose efflux permease n=1 Tax=Pedobacter nutrimenti TaxID=1241337 RepID=A0A318UF79_9SPHI|nr:MFS transporter [Pedobacter nutrimenti]PYF74821.1 putative MFS family arabinose efflux permease [Pedobacter nutrimenti]
MTISSIATFRAFKSDQFKYYFAGRSISQFGTWMQRTAVVWIIYSLTHSAFMLGVTVFAEQFPSFLFSFIGGVAADRYDRSRIIRWTQIGAVVQTSLLALLLLSNHVVVWEILSLSVLLGVINAFDVPARQTMIHQVVQDENDVGSALSLSAAMSSLSKILGPALAGFVLQHWNAGICFVFNAFGFILVMVCFSMMKLQKQKKKPVHKRILEELKDGIVYLKEASHIGLVILMLSLVGLLVLPYDTLMPQVAKVTFNGGPATFGYISGFIGLGAVSGTILLASLRRSDKLRFYLILSTVVLGAGLICFALATNFYWAMLFVMFTGFGSVMQFTSCNIIVQSEALPHMRGRIVSILLTAIFGMLPLGSLLTGYASEHIGSSNTLFIQGLLAILIAIIFYRLFNTPKKDPLSLIDTERTDLP